MSKYKSFILPIYGTKVIMYKDWNIFSKNTDPTLSKDAAHAYTWGSHTWIGKGNATANTIAHESYHLVCNIHEHLGMKVVDEEVIAYNLGYIVDKLTKYYGDK